MPAARAHHVDSADGAAPLLRGLLETGDVVLVKGSRAMGLERVAGAISARFEGAGVTGGAT